MSVCLVGLGWRMYGREGWLTLAAAATAAFWSASLQASVRQHAISPRKDLSSQMHLMSLPQLPIPFCRNLFAQLFCW